MTSIASMTAAIRDLSDDDFAKARADVVAQALAGDYRITRDAGEDATRQLVVRMAVLALPDDEHRKVCIGVLRGEPEALAAFVAASLDNLRKTAL